MSQVTPCGFWLRLAWMKIACPSKRTARTALTVATFMFGAMETVQAQECQPSQIASLGLTSQGLTVPVRFGDSAVDLPFVLELSRNFIARDFAQAHKFRQFSGNASVRIKRLQQEITEQVIAPSFSIGSLLLDGVDFWIFPSPPTENYVGELGTNTLFSKFDVELDFGEMEIKLFPQERCSGVARNWGTRPVAKIPYELGKSDTRIRVRMLLDSKPICVALATNQGSYLEGDVAQRVLGITEKTSDLKLLEQSADERLYSYPFATLGIDSLVIRQPDIAISFSVPAPDCDKATSNCGGQRSSSEVKAQSESTISCVGPPDMTMGLAALSKFDLYFSPREKILYMTPATTY